MSSSSRLDQLRTASPSGAVRLIYRKAVHRRVEMGRYGARAVDCTAPSRLLDLRLDMLGPDRFDAVVGTTPYLSTDDLANFHRQRSICIAVFDGPRIVASSWMTGGEVWVHELQRSVTVPGNEHFSCRSYVDPEYRGLSLLSHMIHWYAAQQPVNDEVWGLVYRWNVESVRSLERIGWRDSGTYWTSWTFGRRSGGHERFTPEPPAALQ